MPTSTPLEAQAADLIPRTKVYGVVDTLEHLAKGGRIGGARALLGSLLSIKPVVSLVDGVVEEESKQRTRARSLQYLAGKIRDGPAAQPGGRVPTARPPTSTTFLGLIDGIPTDHPARGRPARSGGRHAHRSGDHRPVHDHPVLTARPRSGGPCTRPGYPRAMDPKPESLAPPLPGLAGARRPPRPGADPVDTVVDFIQVKTVRPLTLATRGIVFGIIVLAASIVTVTLLAITLIRVLTVYISTAGSGCPT